MFIFVIGLLIGLLIAAFGLYYLLKEEDKQAKKIYRVTLIAGLVIAVFFAVKLFL